MEPGGLRESGSADSLGRRHGRVEAGEDSAWYEQVRLDLISRLRICYGLRTSYSLFVCFWGKFVPSEEWQPIYRLLSSVGKISVRNECLACHADVFIPRVMLLLFLIVSCELAVGSILNGGVVSRRYQGAGRDLRLMIGEVKPDRAGWKPKKVSASKTCRLAGAMGGGRDDTWQRSEGGVDRVALYRVPLAT